MKEQFSKKDLEFMQIALSEAAEAFARQDYPIGAVLVVDNKLIDKASNTINSQDNWIEHAESKLIIKHSQLIKQAVKKESYVELYTTLEPCLMCLGISVLHRLNRLTFACPDPHGGAALINPATINGEWYAEKWPLIRSGLLQEDSYRIMTEYISKKDWVNRDKILALWQGTKAQPSRREG